MRDSRGFPSFTEFCMNTFAAVYEEMCALYVVMYVYDVHCHLPS